MNARILHGYSFEPCAGRPNSPDIPVIGRHSTNEVDEIIVRRPHGKVAVYSRWRHINPTVPAVVEISRLPHEQRVARCGCVVYEPLTIAGPIELAGLPQIWAQWPASRRYGQNTHVAGLRAIRSPVPDSNEQRVRREAERADYRIDQVVHFAMRQIAVSAAALFADPTSISPSRSPTNATNFPSREIVAACSVPGKSNSRVNLACAKGLRQK